MHERLSLFVARRPRTAILLAIIFFNLVFFFVAALLIYFCSPGVSGQGGFWATVFYTVSMVLDAGCVQYIVQDASQANALVVVLCIVIVIVGMVSFTGAVIGYVTTWITGFIGESNSSRRPLHVAGHTVILNWNSRGAEIVNDMLYAESREKVVVLVESGAEDVERDLNERLADTLAQERARGDSDVHMPKIVVRQGTVFSTKQLRDIALERAKSVIILCEDRRNEICGYRAADEASRAGRGDSVTIKTLIQVADMTAAEQSADDQKIVVEVSDPWTGVVVDRIVEHKEKQGKCNIVPVPAGKLLGRILSQLAIMPELNEVYSELFSNKGACFCSQIYNGAGAHPDDVDFVRDYLAEHCHAIPLTFANTKEGLRCFFLADNEESISAGGYEQGAIVPLQVNARFGFRRKNVLIIGGNSELNYLMDGFESFCGEWQLPGETNILNIGVIHDTADAGRVDFEKCPYVSYTAEAGVYDREVFYERVESFIDANPTSLSILLLSDDKAAPKDVDANVLVYLVYIQDILKRRSETERNFSIDDIDIIVEILDPKNFDVVMSYDINNVVMSNRYISKMVTQISERDAIYDFYADILAYDEAGTTAFDSNEVYIKPACDFFDLLPGTCTADALIRSVYESCLAIPGEYVNKTLLLGYFRDGEMKLFAGSQACQQVTLRPDDQLVVFSNH